MKKLYISIVFCILLWSYRLFSLNTIITEGYLIDFKISYYDTLRTIINGQPDSLQIAQSTLGPPFVLIPYFPLAFLPLKLAEYILTITNIICYFLVFYTLTKKFIGKHTWSFWLLLGLLAFSFPIIFSLGMGNPIGVVTLGIYAFWIFKNKWLQMGSFILAIFLKIFPIVLLGHYLLSIKKSSIIVHFEKIAIMLALMIFFSLFTALIIPADTWPLYKQHAQRLYKATPDAKIYNQSFSSTLARAGLFIPSFSLIYWSFATTIVAIVTLIILKLSRLKNFLLIKDVNLKLAVLFLTLTLLLHPAPWQYYFAVLIPFLIIRIQQRRIIYLLIFLMLSFDGGKWQTEGLLKTFTYGSQFFGALILFIAVTYEMKSINLKTPI